MPSPLLSRCRSRAKRALALIIAALVPTACAGEFSVLDPASPEARGIADVGWFMFVLAAGVMLVVGVLLVVALWRARGGRQPGESRLNGVLLVVGGGVVLPLLVLPVLWVLTLQGMAALAQPQEPSELVIEIEGTRWHYDVFYPATGVLLVNEVRVPVGEPVLLRLTSDDVVHSFWVPRLTGKTDLIPGLVNEAWLRAGQPGTYAGRCAEYCGIGHTEMGLTVIAQPRQEFEAWLAAAAP